MDTQYTTPEDFHRRVKLNDAMNQPYNPDNPSLGVQKSVQEIFDTVDPMMSKVVKPNHYAKWAIEPITLIMRNGMEFWRGNIIKYATRAGNKSYDGMDAVQSEITDLEKVRRYAEMRINQLKGEITL